MLGITMGDIWYYSTGRRRKGPVDTQTLRQMAWAGKLQPQHMVWKAGMADWSQAGKMPELFAQPVPSAPPLPPPGAGGQVLVEAPTGLTTYGDEYSEGLIWRDGKILMMHKDAKLPLRCARTNEPVEKLRKRKLVWHSPLWLLLLLVGLLPCLIVILCVQKKAKIMIGLSKRAVRRRRIAIAVGWLGPIVGATLLVFGLAGPSWMADAGGLLIPVSLIYAIVRGWTLLPSRIDDYYVHLKGCCPEYLNAFPPLPAQATVG